MRLPRFKNRAVSGVLGAGLLTGAVGYAAIFAAPRSLPADNSLARSDRMAYSSGKRFFITLTRDADFPATVTQIEQVRCRFVRDGFPDVAWPLSDGSYARHALPRHATFGFDAVGLHAGTIVITIDDDEFGPIAVDPTGLNPCATPGPVSPKPFPRRGE